MNEQGYEKLEIYRLGYKLAVEIHRITMSLPKFELYEEGGQIRRSSKSVPAQIAEGYCLRKNKKEFVQYLNRAYGSVHETVVHLDLLFETRSLADAATYGALRSRYDVLCKMIFRFMEGVIEGHGKPGFARETDPDFESIPTSLITNPTSRR